MTDDPNALPTPAPPAPDAPTSAAEVSAERTPGSLAPPSPTLRRAVPRHFWKAAGASAVAVVAVVGLAGRFGALAQVFGGTYTPAAPAAEAPAPPSPAAEAAPVAAPRPTFTFRGHVLHPDLLFAPYLSDAVTASPSEPASELIGPFRAFLGVFAQRQGEDDNFTIRVSDTRSGETITAYVLENERARYEAAGAADWDAVDAARRVETTRLLDRYQAQGIPRDAMSVKWGRANQVREARERDAPYLMHEIALARRHGLSLLATEIGTVETFNDDRAVSTVGARSRYQMMPDVLRRNDLRRYALRTVGGTRLDVAEEWHPLLTMGASFLTIRGYANAVGHEVPGISSYHTGPGNVFAVYRQFLAHGLKYYAPAATVMDAYMWGVTEGYPIVSSQTSFKTYSRGYVASAYGALRATEGLAIDPTRTIRADLVRLRAGERVALSTLLARLATADLNWNAADGVSRYEAFRAMNAHLTLPVSRAPGVPANGDVLLTAEAEGGPVRFFLPVGAAEALREAGSPILDAAATERFDERSADEMASEATAWDREYDAFVRRSSLLAAFTYANRERLEALATEFDMLYAASPTRYRKEQLDVIRTHRMFWRTQAFEKLADAVGGARGAVPVPILPPMPAPIISAPLLSR